MSMSFAERSRRSQLLQLRHLAEAAVQRFGLHDARLIPVQHWMNSTYYVIASGQRYALRIQRAEQQNRAEVWSEMVWLQALRSEAGLTERAEERKFEVLEPVRTVDGELLAVLESPQVPGPRICVLFKWMEGRSLYKGLTRELMNRVGEFLAHIHLHSEQFEPPEGFTRPRWDASTFRGGAGGALNVDIERCRAHLSVEQWDVIERMSEVVQQSLTAMPEERRSFGMIHADFHPGNLLFHKGQVRAMDFELCGRGYYLYDVAVMHSVLVGRHPKYEELRSGFNDGYRKVRALTDHWVETIDMFIAARKMIRSLWLAQQIGLPVWEGAELRVKQEIDYIRAYLRSRAV